MMLDGGFFQQVVRVSHYQEEIRAAIDQAGTDMDGRPVIRVLVATDPTGGGDPKAVKVTDLRGTTLGYLPSKDATKYSKNFEVLLRTGDEVSCLAKVYGGERDKPSYGLRLNVDLRALAGRG